MFVLASQYVFWFPVKVSVPDPESPGKFNEQTFEVRFEALEMDELNQIDEANASSPASAYPSNQAKLLARVIKDWRGVVDPDKAEIPFSDTSLKGALQFSWVRNSLYSAYLKALSGEARTGN